MPLKYLMKLKSKIKEKCTFRMSKCGLLINIAPELWQILSVLSSLCHGDKSKNRPTSFSKITLAFLVPDVNLFLREILFSCLSKYFHFPLPQHELSKWSWEFTRRNFKTKQRMDGHFYLLNSKRAYINKKLLRKQWTFGCFQSHEMNACADFHTEQDNFAVINKEDFSKILFALEGSFTF